MFALKFHLPTSERALCETSPRLLNVLRMLTVSPWSTRMWLLTSACIQQRFLSTSFTKLSQIESVHIWTQVDHLPACLKEIMVKKTNTEDIKEDNNMKPKICQKYQLSENLNSFELPLDCFKLADQPLALLRLPSEIV